MKRIFTNFSIEKDVDVFEDRIVYRIYDENNWLFGHITSDQDKSHHEFKTFKNRKWIFRELEEITMIIKRLDAGEEL